MESFNSIDTKAPAHTSGGFHCLFRPHYGQNKYAQNCAEALDLWSLATEGTQESKNMARLCLAKRGWGGIPQQGGNPAKISL